ncbi:MAG: arylsulfatase [Rubripirellula sp.]
MYLKIPTRLTRLTNVMTRLHPSCAFGAAWIIGCFLMLTTSANATENERPNLVVILADDLGYSDLGCYGGEIRTPHLDRLAHNGVRMTQMYNAARCCSTRASLLTGLYPHQAGVGAMTADNHKPGYRGFLTDRCVTVAERLKASGYQTLMSGKWHLRGKGNPLCTPTERGFDEFYGHFRAYASYYRPDLFVRHPAGRTQPQYEASNFYATDAITDQAIELMQSAGRNQAPFFLYLAYNAPHFPLQAPKEVIDAYATTYQVGWDKIRQSRLQRMLDIGIVREGAELSPRGHVTKVPERNGDSPYYDQTIPAWGTIDPNRRADLSRRMATYAAMVQIMDANIGRVIDHLRQTNLLDNTLIVFLSDNGACAEWDPYGFDNNPYPKNRLYEGDSLQSMGGPGTFHSYGTGWANACNAPLRLYKHYNHEGGISSPLIMHWPDGMSRVGEIDRRPAHITDLTATLLDLGMATYPQRKGDQEILPLAGRSLRPIIENRPWDTRPIFFEHEGNRAVRIGPWKLVWTNYDQRWELYQIDTDRSELHDRAAEFPNRVREMQDLWHRWAANHFVETQRVQQPESGMPKIYYSPAD